MEESVFTKIINNELPSHKVYEDDKTVAFMDIYPVQVGMVVVVPKVQVDEFIDLDDDEYISLMRAVKVVSSRLKSLYPDKRIGVVIEGFEVPHVHVKLIPISSGADLFSPQDSSVEPDHAALAEVASKLAIEQ